MNRISAGFGREPRRLSIPRLGAGPGQHLFLGSLLVLPLLLGALMGDLLVG